MCLSLFLIMLVLGLVWPVSAQAVLPPDFIFNVGTQVVQTFSILAVFLSASISVVFRMFKDKVLFLRNTKPWVKVVAVGLVIFVSGVGSLTYGKYQQQVEYNKWLEESLLNSPVATATPKPRVGFLMLPELDRLEIGGTTPETVSPTETTEGENTKFIREYYRKIADKDYLGAYAMSKKSVDFETFKGWYKTTTGIKIDKVTLIDEIRLSLELTLEEGIVTTRYGVLVALKIDQGKPIQVEKSQVRILQEDSGKITVPFFEEQGGISLVTTNDQLKSAIDNKRSDYVVLDARENIEYENGYFPESIHIRFADLKAGRWIELPTDKQVYVFCWSGIRGKEVAEFLRSKKIVASYMENGANGWVAGGGKWVGSISFGVKYDDIRYQRVYTTAEVKQLEDQGVKLVDCRQPDKFKGNQIGESVNIPIMYTATVNMENAFAQVTAGSRVITICDDYVNCFDAKVTGVELERRGMEFLGRYNKPWEYVK